MFIKNVLGDRVEHFNVGIRIRITLRVKTLENALFLYPQKICQLPSKIRKGMKTQ